MEHRAVALVKICALAILLQACSQPPPVNNIPAYNAANLNVHLQNGVLLQGNSPFTGIIYALQANNKDTSEIVSFKQGLEHGLWKKFYPGNKLMEKRYFSNGRKIGEYDVWWPNGAVKLIYHFKDGELDGNCRAWTDKGLLIEDMNYKSGYEDGKQEQFYDDGRVKANYVITDGRRYGLLGTKNCVNVTDSIFKK